MINHRLQEQRFTLGTDIEIFFIDNLNVLILKNAFTVRLFPREMHCALNKKNEIIKTYLMWPVMYLYISYAYIKIR